MAHSKSAQKRIRQNESRRALNRWRKRTYRQQINDYDELILHGSVEDAQSKLDTIYKSLDRTAAKGAIHPRTAARYKSRLSAKLNAKKAGA